ncbi:GlcG/HbpS family heme-binding protein [Halotalea alkalilenta]|uniref:GlcG/HbpS family heme-binding protein n=1 Tax=Halotalea alkalilenta TaxID=376489 RepID=UPI0004880D0A|nr:heme-binding protein [Halotalea alkalilenta]
MSREIDPAPRLTHFGALCVLQAAMDEAEAIGVGQNIAVVDEGGNLVAFVRMDGAKLLSRETAISKAISAASHRCPTGRLDDALELKLAIASGGRLTNLEGGEPLLVDGYCVGGIGVGSGSGAQDVQVARAGAMALSQGAAQ